MFNKGTVVCKPQMLQLHTVKCCKYRPKEEQVQEAVIAYIQSQDTPTGKVKLCLILQISQPYVIKIAVLGNQKSPQTWPK